MTDHVSDWLRQEREKWTNTGAKRPPFAEIPGPGQESVWDFPRPPAIQADSRLIEVRTDRATIASGDTSIRVLETSHPPSFYVPAAAIADGALVTVAGGSHCEWKGPAEYVADPQDLKPIGWRYPHPYPEFDECANWVSFYPDRVDCYVDGELVRAQAGGFYGGWITDDVVGPFKGDPGTSNW